MSKKLAAYFLAGDVTAKAAEALPGQPKRIFLRSRPPLPIPGLI